MNDLTVNISKTISAPINSVFDAWLNPVMLAKFILPMPGMANPQVENDPKENGEFTIVMQVGEHKVPHTGKYLTIERPYKLAFTWESPESVDDSIVTIKLSELPDNLTKIELSHVKFIDETRRANHEGGWGNILNNLNELASDLS